MNITPGEPAPPGFEEEMNRQPEIQNVIDQYKGNALIGLEYTVELYEGERHEPAYLCTLCDKRGDPRTIMQHWTSFNHRVKYLEKHYPTAMRECLPEKYKPNGHTTMTLIVQALAEAVEDHHGRLTLTVMNADEFRRKKTHYTEEINNKFHFSERNGPSFVNAIDRTLCENNSKKRKEPGSRLTANAPKTTHSDTKTDYSKSGRNELDEISSDSDHGAEDTVKKQKIVHQQEAAYRILPRVRRSPPFEEDRDKKKLPTPKELSLQASHIAQERYKWEKYRCMVEIQLKQMEKIQQDYEKSPEKHPSYPEEWKKFWNRRYKELQAEKKVDPNKYDYKPEWIVYWTERMKELFADEVEKKKKEIKLKLGLPEDAEEKVEQLKEKYKVPVTRAVNTKKPKEKTPSEDVIDISDDDSPRHPHKSRARIARSRSRSRSRNRSRSRSLSPFSDDYELTSKHYNPVRHRTTVGHGSRVYNAHAHEPSATTADDYYSYARSRLHARYPPTTSHFPPTTTHYRVLDSHKIPKYDETTDAKILANEAKKDENKEEEPEGCLTVVAVLRLLTALEDHLGSLGPKVVDLLGKALALEKVKANSSDDLLLNEDHCVFFETIKEKLKGLLIADVLDDQHKVRAVKKAVKNIAAIVHLVTTKGPQNPTDRNSAIEAGNKDNFRNTNQKLNRNSSKSATGPNLKDLPFDRQVIATKMAASLVMQGREDVSTADMDKLIYLFILMVKMSKVKRDVDGDSLYTKHILPQLGVAVPAAPPPLSPKHSNSSIRATVALSLPAIVDELFEKEITSLVQEVEEEIDNESVDKESKSDANSSTLESLTDSDLQTLLQNFKHLSSEEQHHLIAHLKKLESADPARVEKLRKFVNFADMMQGSDAKKESRTKDVTPSTQHNRNIDCSDAAPSSSSKKQDRITPPGTEEDERRRVNPNKFTLDDDDDEDEDDYNFEEVFKAASSNVNVNVNSRSTEEHARQSLNSVESKNSRSTHEPAVPGLSSTNALTFNPAGLNISLNDTQNLIANLMGSLQQSNSNSKTVSSNNPKPAMVPEPVPPVSTQSHAQATAAATTSGVAKSSVSGVGGVGNQMHIIPTNVSYYQQTQAQPHHPGYGMEGYNQMQNPQTAANGYYNMMPGNGSGYNQNAYTGVGGAPYQQWANAQIPPNMQPYGMQNFGIQPHTQQMGYNMYGPGGN